MAAKDKIKLEENPALGISLQLQLDERRQVVFQTHVAQDMGEQAINALLDKLARVADRQEARYRLGPLKKQLEANETIIERATGDLARVDERNRAEWSRQQKRGDPRLSAKDTQDKANIEISVKRLQQDSDRLKIEIKECEALLGGEAAPRG